MQKTNYKIRTMAHEEIDTTIDWAAAEGWNPGLHDADCFYAADPSGFLIGLLDDQPIAVISAVKYGTSFGFLGFYIVKPEYRGQGYGMQIWNAALASLQGRTIGLDGVVAQQENYKKSGFALAYRNIRYQGAGGGDSRTDAEIVELATVPFAEICAYDAHFFPDDRKQFLACWIKQPNSKALGIMQHRKLAGYGMIRPCRLGYKIGPLLADSPGLAERLFSALKAHVEQGVPIFLDIPEVNPEALALVERHNMTAMFETARMYAGRMPELPTERIFGVTSFELG